MTASPSGEASPITPSVPSPGAQARREARLRDEAPVRIILLRHGEPDWFPAGGLSVDDAGLTARGRAQAEAAASILGDQRLDAIYVSPLRRAQETADPVAKACGIVPVTLDALAEIGIQTPRMSQPEVDHFFMEAMRRPLDRHWEGWPRGESFHAFHARVTRGIGEILARHAMYPERKGEFTVWQLPQRQLSLAVVAHGGTNAVLLTHLLDVAPLPWEWIRFESELAAYTVVQARPLGQHGAVWSLIRFNEVAHLQAAGLR
ncbi:MAG TPA: histidine phosphatase family protein [Myxococcota bacterium]|nr:histidine phosphatase family protein [Myxococcota bacterium]